MKENKLLIIASLLSVFFTSVHITGDILYGFEKGGASDLIILPILAIWLYATFILTERKWGYIIIILVSLLGLLVPILHMKGTGIGGQVTNSLGGYLFVWTTISLGVSSLLSIILAIRGLIRRKQLT